MGVRHLKHLRGVRHLNYPEFSAREKVFAWKFRNPEKGSMK
jgi:hypothetical protein